MSKKALLVIDMLNDFVKSDGALPVPDAEELVPRIKEVIDRFRAKNLPVIYVCDSHMPDDKEFDVWGRHAVFGTKGAAVVEELSPLENEPVIRKRRFSGFYGTDLDLTLRENEIDEVVLTGVLTNICVLYTGSDAYQRGYKVTVLKDCVKSVDSSMHEFALKQLKEVVGASIIDSRDLDV